MARHHRVLIAGANDGLLLWESLRRCPEGLAAALVDTESAKEALLKFSATMDESERPMIAVMPGLPYPEEAMEIFSCPVFDHIISREPWRRINNTRQANQATENLRAGTEGNNELNLIDNFAVSAAKLLVPGGIVSILQSPPRLGERISRILSEECAASSSLSEKLSRAEEDFFQKSTSKDHANNSFNSQILNLSAENLEECFVNSDFKVTIKILDQTEERLITEKDNISWFNKEKSVWGSFIFASIGEKDFQEVRNLMANRIKEGPISWKWKSILVKAIKK